MFYGKLLIMKTFKFKDINEFLGTRQLGKIARERLLFVSVDDFARQNIAIAFRRRLNAMKQEVL